MVFWPVKVGKFDGSAAGKFPGFFVLVVVSFGVHRFEDTMTFNNDVFEVAKIFTKNDDTDVFLRDAGLGKTFEGGIEESAPAEKKEKAFTSAFLTAKHQFKCRTRQSDALSWQRLDGIGIAHLLFLIYEDTARGSGGFFGVFWKDTSVVRVAIF